VNAATATALTVPECHALLHMALELPSPPADVEAGTVALGDTLEILAAVNSGTLQWDWVWPGERDEDAALAVASEEVAAAADYLITALAKIVAGAAA
jgi:hypothetical protein